MNDNYESRIRKVLQAHNVSDSWPGDVMREISSLASEIGSQDRSGRRDLTDLPFVTIDGDTAQDFDDAVYAVAENGGWQLYVAIADVSRYVPDGSATDREAFARGNSVYFQDFMLPMLHARLSTDLCSLKPAADRLALVCQMFIASDGSLEKYGFYPAVIRSQARLTYNDVQDMITGKDSVIRQYHGVYPHIYRLYEMYPCPRCKICNELQISFVIKRI